MGPYEAECPAAILDLLTATENAHALDWRRRCRASLERKSRKLADGDRIRLSATITFTDGHEGSEFLVERRGRRTVLRDPTSGRGYRISRLMQRDWTIVPVTRVHKRASADRHYGIFNRKAAHVCFKPGSIALCQARLAVQPGTCRAGCAQDLYLRPARLHHTHWKSNPALSCRRRGLEPR
jgi:hypothetical protein